MAEWVGGGEHHFQCDFCDTKSDVETDSRRPFKGDIPDGWWFINLGQFVYESTFGEIRHFCSLEHAKAYLKSYPDFDKTSDKMVE